MSSDLPDNRSANARRDRQRHLPEQPGLGETPESDFPDQAGDADGAANDPAEQARSAEELAVCWRCDKPFPRSLAACHWCAAPNRAGRVMTTSSFADGNEPGPADSSGEAAADSRQLKIFFFTYVMLLVSSVIYGAIMLFGVNASASDPEALDVTRFTLMTVIQVIDSLLVLYAIANCGRIARTPPTGRPWIAWLLLVPLLAGLLAINFGYHHLVELWVGHGEEELLMNNQRLWWWVLLNFCVQPAIVEELFVRFLMLGILRQHMSTGTALLISSLAFALLHLGAPLSVPYLFLAGLAFGYLRVASGGLLLPIIAHFVHNLIVVSYHQS